MKESYLFDMAFNNVVFRNRNMAYGAYRLRKNYNRHIALAALIATAVFAGALATPVIRTIMIGPPEIKQNTPIPQLPDTVIYEPLLPPPLPEPKVEEQVVTQPKQEKVATEKFVSIKVVDNNVDTPEDVPEQSKFENALISNETNEGEAQETPTTVIEPEGPAGTGTATSTEPYNYAEEMPEFGKGEKDLINYLSKNIRYPVRARNAGIEGMVIVSFVVTAQGEVQDVKILKGLGYGTEEEASRVVKNMPKWKPGKQNGRAVPVRYTLPIRLQMQN